LNKIFIIDYILGLRQGMEGGQRRYHIYLTSSGGPIHVFLVSDVPDEHGQSQDGTHSTLNGTPMSSQLEFKNSDTLNLPGQMSQSTIQPQGIQISQHAPAQPQSAQFQQQQQQQQQQPQVVVATPIQPTAQEISQTTHHATPSNGTSQPVTEDSQSMTQMQTDVDDQSVLLAAAQGEGGLADSDLFADPSKLQYRPGPV
jgi:hypothetical protein